MSKVKILLTIFGIIFLAQGLQAQKREPGDTEELMNQIRRDKFDIYLAQVMRENKIDMWIHVIRPWATDPLAYEFGSNSAVFIFTDRGKKRIERAVFKFGREVVDPGAYDIIGEEAEDLDQQNYYVPKDPDKAPGTELDLRFIGLGEFVTERNPQRIAVNYSEKLSLAEGSEVRALTDGISHTDYLLLVKALGDKYAKRMVSAEYLILDYLSRRVKKEIEFHKLMGLKANEYLAKEFTKIVPGVTRLEQLGQNVFVRDPDGNEHNNDDYVIQRGDLVGILYGAGDMRRIMDADTGGTGYVLQEGETDLPPEVKKIWAESMKVREILQKNIKAGPRAGETLELLIPKLEEAGFVYIDKDQYDRNADTEKTQVHLDLHAMGKGVIAPRISPMGPRWHWDMNIPLYHTFTFEYMVHMPVPGWGRGKHLYICMHDGVMVTERGVEFPYPPAQGIHIIR
jgi:Xaa-Pro dipeptidase